MNNKKRLLSLQLMWIRDFATVCQMTYGTESTTEGWSTGTTWWTETSSAGTEATETTSGYVTETATYETGTSWMTTWMTSETAEMTSVATETETRPTSTAGELMLYSSQITAGGCSVVEANVASRPNVKVLFSVSASWWWCSRSHTSWPRGLNDAQLVPSVTTLDLSLKAVLRDDVRSWLTPNNSSVGLR